MKVMAVKDLQEAKAKRILTYAQVSHEEEVIAAADADMDLSRFDAASLIAFTATKETDDGIETDGRIPARCGADRADQWADAQAGG